MSPAEGASQVKKKYEICQKKFLIGQKFLTQGEITVGIRLVRQAYRIAVEYSFMALASELSGLLYHHHIYYQRNTTKANQYAEEAENYLRDYLAEKKAEYCLYSAILNTNRATQATTIKTALQDLQSYRGNSIRYMVFKSTLGIMLGFHTGDHHQVIQNCQRALQFFKGKNGVYQSHYQLFWSKQGVAQMVLGKYSEATNSFKNAKKYAIPKSFNDYLARYYQTLNALRSGDYPLAYILYRQNRRCRYPVIRLQFAIIEAYLCFLSTSGYLALEGKFRLGKYLNETFQAQADKQGDNINIIIAELLVLLTRNRGKFIDRIEAIQHYSYRHLKDQDTRRAKWFIKILCLLPGVNFHPIALERRAKVYLDKLTQHPLRMGENFAIEIIPFEHLLQMILQKLKQRVA